MTRRITAAHLKEDKTKSIFMFVSYYYSTRRRMIPDKLVYRQKKDDKRGYF